MSSNIYDKYAQLKEELEEKDPLKRYARIKQELDTIKQEQVESNVEDTKEKEIKTLESLESLFQFLGGKEDAIETEPEVVEEPAEILPEEVHEVIEEIEEPKSEEKIETVIVEEPITDKTTVDNVAEIITKHEKEKDKKEIVEETDLVAARIDKLEKWIQKIAVAGPGSGEVRLNNLDDVDITGLANNKSLKWNASTNKWEIGIGGIAVNEVGSVLPAIDVEVAEVSEIQFDVASGFALTDLAEGVVKVAMESTFKTWQVEDQDDLVATALDTIELIAGADTSITTDATSTPQSITFNTDLSGVGQAIVPDTDVTYDLGSSTYKWKDLYLSGGSIKLGDATISVSGAGDIQTQKGSEPITTMVTTAASKVTFFKQDNSASNISTFTVGNASVQDALTNQYIPFTIQNGTAVTTVAVG